jgi:hypothetical protein
MKTTQEILDMLDRRLAELRKKRAEESNGWWSEALAHKIGEIELVKHWILYP